MIMKMKNLVPVFAALVAAPFAVAAETPADALAAPAAEKSVEITPEQRTLFLQGLGWIVGTRGGIEELRLSEADSFAVAEGFRLALLGKGRDIPEKIFAQNDAYEKFVTEMQTNALRQEKAEREAASAENKKLGEAFVAKTVAEDKSFETLPSGVLLKIVAAGAADKKPTLADTISIRYTGKLISGVIFDSSARDEKTGEPKAFVAGEGATVELPLGALIPAWQEALPRIGEGGRCTIVAPAAQAYGDRAVSVIPAGSTLVFDIELVKILPPEAAADEEESAAEADAPAPEK